LFENFTQQLEVEQLYQQDCSCECCRYRHHDVSTNHLSKLFLTNNHSWWSPRYHFLSSVIKQHVVLKQFRTLQ